MRRHHQATRMRGHHGRHDEWRAKKKPRSGDTQYGAKYPGTNTPCRDVQTLARRKLAPHEEAPGAESTGAPALLEGDSARQRKHNNKMGSAIL
jgi:hypothetical protein